MNILVYSGKGVSLESLHHTIRSLKRSVGMNYDIKTVTPEILAKEPWESNCSLLVIPGGRDLPYVNDLQGLPIEKIQRFILERKGRYLGICAGAYFACRRVRFEEGKPIEVMGNRELALCPATAIGTLYDGFEYGSENGAHAVPVGVLSDSGKMEDIRMYYNGGCWFQFDKETPSDARLQFKLAGIYNDRDKKPAFVLGYLKEEQVASVALTGVHVEYDAIELYKRKPDIPILKDLIESDTKRAEFWNRILVLLGLKLNLQLSTQNTVDADETPPLPTPLYLFFPDARKRSAFLTTLKNDEHYHNGRLNCERQQFKFIEDIVKEENLGSPDLDREYPVIVVRSFSQINQENIISKWSFSPETYFSKLLEMPTVNGVDYIGKNLLYAEYIESTQTLVSLNSKLASIIPNGTIILAGDQLGGRGRGKNSWLSSKGCLQFTMILHHRQASTLSLVQYLVGLSMVEAILNESGYENLPIFLKWPNDLYSSFDGELRKLGGILVNSQTFNDDFLLLIGFGCNIFDTPWTRSLNDIVSNYNSVHGTNLPPWSKELVLSKFAHRFAELYRSLIATGFPFDRYYQRWLHTDQIVYLEEEGIKVRIKGIDGNGFLMAKPHSEGLLGLLNNNIPNIEKVYLLQPDGNSFDLMKNLIKRKT